MQTRAIQIHRHGGPEVLEEVSVALTPPGPREVTVRQSAIGLNFADIYQRRGSAGPHAAAAFPLILGAHGAGTIEAVGAEVTGWYVGQSVAYIHPGAYQAARNVPASRLVALPPTISQEVAGAQLLRGLTAEYLLRRLHRVRPGEAVLVHAAAGGMGQLLAEWARSLGATVIGTVGSPEKMDVARAHGCHHVFDYRRDNFASLTLEATGGEGVAVVYDAVGRDVFLPSLDCLRPMGIAINYGTASGDVEAFDLQRLHARSLSVCRPTLRTFIADPADLQRGAASLFDAVAQGEVHLRVARRHALADVREAHEALEGGRTMGAAMLVP